MCFVFCINVNVSSHVPLHRQRIRGPRQALFHLVLRQGFSIVYLCSARQAGLLAPKILLSPLPSSAGAQGLQIRVIKSCFLCGFLAFKLRSSHLHRKLFAYCAISPVNPQVTFMCLVTALDPHESSDKKKCVGVQRKEGVVQLSSRMLACLKRTRVQSPVLKPVEVSP